MYKKTNKFIFFTLICAFTIANSISSLSSPFFFRNNYAPFDKNPDHNPITPKTSDYNESIYINGNLMFAALAISENWDGEGSFYNPYIIEKYNVSAFSEHGVEIRNTNLHFIMRNVSIINGRSNYYHGFYLHNVTNGILQNNTANNNLAGFLLVDSNNNTLADNNANNNLHGIRFWHSNNNTLTNSTINSNLEYGLYLDQSNYNRITQNTLFYNTLGSIVELDCVGNIILYNLLTPSQFFLESDCGIFDDDGTFTLIWTVSQGAINYTLYQNGEILVEGLTVTEYNLIDLPPGTYEYYVKALNTYGNVSSNTIKVIVKFLIHIDGNLNFHQSAIDYNFSGDGSINDPYIIEDYEIYATIGHGVHIRNTDLHFIIRDVIVRDGAKNQYYGFYLENVTHARLEKNAAHNNQYGFYIKNSFNNTLISNSISENANGLTLNCSYHNNLTSNLIKNNRHGFSIESSFNNTISMNEIIDNIYLGFYLSASSNNTLVKNNATGNINGFTLSYSNSNIFFNNNANYNDQHGFRLLHSNYNKIIENSASYNQKYGIYLEESPHNIISGNILVGNGMGSISEKLNDTTEYPDVFLIISIIFLIGISLFIVFKSYRFITKKKITLKTLKRFSIKKKKK